MDPILFVILAIIVIGALLYYLLPESPMKALGVKVLTFIVIVLLILWLLRIFGLMPHGLPHGG